MQKLWEIAQSVSSKEDFLNFISALVEELRNCPDENWENNNLESYLEAIQSWTEDMDGYYINNNMPIPETVSWKVFADILMAATMYE